MKKFLSVILAFILLMAFMPFAYAVTGRYIVTANFAAVYKSPNITSEKIAEITKNTYVDITEVRSNNFGKAYIAKDGVTGWIQMENLTKADEPSANTGIKEIVIKSFPTKTTYIDGLEELDLSGLKVASVDKNGKETVITGYSVYAPELKAPGEKTVKISYSPDGINYFYVSFTVEVVRVPVKSISIEKLPLTQYKEHAPLDLSALQIKTEFQDPSLNKVLTFEEIKNDSDYIITSCHGEAHGSRLEKGEHTINISYKYPDISCSFTVDVIPRKLVSLEIKQAPDSVTVYDRTKLPALDGLILEAKYDNGEIEDIYHYDCKAVCEPSQFMIGPGNMVDVYFGDLFVTINFIYSEVKPKGIRIQTPSPVLSFLKGEEIDLSGIRVYLYYTDGSFEEIFDYTISNIDYAFIGTQNIVVRYKEFSEVLPIIITAVFSKGDINADGKVTAGDARTVLRASVGLSTLAGATFFAGDADRDGRISAADARLILRASVGLENLYITL